MRETTWIYGLKEEGSPEVRYVGASVDPLVRMRMHLSCRSSQVVSDWVRECEDQGVQIELVCLESIPAGSLGAGNRHPDVAEAEDRWIVKLLDEGHRLLNTRRPETHKDSAKRDKKLLEEAIERGRRMFGPV